MGFLVLPGDVVNAPRPERWQPTPGEYILRITEAKEEPYTNSKTQEQGSRLSLACEIEMGPGQASADNGKTVYHTLFLTGGDAKAQQNNLGQLKVFLEAIDLLQTVAQNGNQLDTDWFVNRKFACHIAIKKDFPRVSDERPVGAPSTRGGKAAPAPQAQQRPAVAQPGFLPPVQQPPAVPPMTQPQPQQYAAQPQQYAQMPQMPQMPGYPQQPPQQPAVAVPPPPQGYQVPGQGR